MNRRWLMLAATLLFAGCSGADQPALPTATAASVASPAIKPVPAAAGTQARYDGYGDMRFGMDEATFEQAWSGEPKGAQRPESSCFYKSPKWVKLPSDFAFMFEDGRFVRYDVGTAKETAPGGGKIGMSEAQIRELYGARVEGQPHKYVDGAEYLRIAAPQGSGVLLFETDAQGHVTRWRVGVPPQVDYVEGCS